VLFADKPCVANPTIDTTVEEKLSVLLRVLEEYQPPKREIGVQFFETVYKKPSWFGKNHEDVCWEQWVIEVVMEPPSGEQEASRRKTEKQLHDILVEIVNQVNCNKDHIPPITTTDSTPFPYHIVVSTEETEGWGSVFNFKGMLE
jgi:autophagy-related protein 101